MTLGQTIDYVNKKFPDELIKIYDSPPGTSCPVIEATKDADFVILVTEPTPFGLHDLKLAVETMKELKKEFADRICLPIEPSLHFLVAIMLEIDFPLVTFVIISSSLCKSSFVLLKE